MDEESEVYRVSEFCKRYKISRTSLYKEVKENRLRLVKRGRRTLIAHLEAERWFAALCQQAQPPQMA
jgi:excisionase family DNA binding protein